MNRLRDHYPFDEDKGFAGPLDPATFPRPREPRSARWLLAMPFIGLACWGAVVWVGMMIF